MGDAHIRLIEKMKKHSSRIASYVDSEAYRVCIEDGIVSDDVVCFDVFTSLIEELHELGITFTISAADLFSSTYEVDMYIDLFGFITPSLLTKKLSTDQRLKSGIENILANPLGNDSIVISYIELIKNTTIDPQIYAACDLLSDKITSSDIFNTYMSNLVTQSYATYDIYPSSKAFDAFINGSVSYALSIMHVIYNSLDIAYVEARLHEYVEYMRNKDTYNRNAWVMLKDDTSEKYPSIFSEQYRICVSGCSLFKEYWKYANSIKAIQKEDLILICALEKYREKTTSFMNIYKRVLEYLEGVGVHVLSEETLQLIDILNKNSHIQEIRP
jgi:hypothetical protein